MNESERAQAEAAGLRLQTALNLGQGQGVATEKVSNEWWAEQDRLGRLLLGHFEKQEQDRHPAPTETEN